MPGMPVEFFENQEFRRRRKYIYIPLSQFVLIVSRWQQVCQKSLQDYINNTNTNNKNLYQYFDYAILNFNLNYNF